MLPGNALRFQEFLGWEALRYIIHLVALGIHIVPLIGRGMIFYSLQLICNKDVEFSGFICNIGDDYFAFGPEDLFDPFDFQFLL